MSLSEVLQPAITYAREGFPVSELIARAWYYETPRLQDNPDTVRTYLVDGRRAPHPGEVFRQADLARTLQLIADEGRDAFYRGPIAEAIVRASDQYGGLFSLQDFASHTSTWETPIGVDYRGYTVYECPPNGQGLTALLALNILKGYDVGHLQPCSAELIHLQIEALRLAFADAGTYIADPQVADIPLEALLSDRYSRTRRALVNPERALLHVQAGMPAGGNDTVYLTVVDEAGNAVSFINSIAAHFGSGVVAGRTGICLQNRATGFVLDPDHRNCVAPGKRPFHTIIPCMVLRGDELWSSFGVMGGLMQPQGHVQVLMDMVDFGMNPQEAMDAPRFEILPPWPDVVALEPGISPEARGKLEQMGHQIIPGKMFGFGGGQVIVVDPATGARHGGSEPRKDGCIVAY
jgi:gamma-glutamyltranspeptidase/glutathione hydrolase